MARLTGAPPGAVTSADALVTAALHDVMHRGKHLSSAIDSIFSTMQPNETLASNVRARMYAALRTTAQPDAEDASASDRSFPRWLRTRLSAQQKAWLLTDAPVVIRTNTLKASRAELLERLSPHEPMAHASLEDAIVIERPFGVYRTAAFREGWFEQQDAASQRVAAALDVQPGMRVIDACAGNGGKTLHLACLMKNRGRIVALDPHEHKLAALRSRCARAGVTIAEPRQIASTKTVKRLAEGADRVLIDAPCTGSGVVRRNPDMLWHFTEVMFEEILRLQADILWRSAMMVRTKGKVVYATCSLLPEEGEQQIQRFLDHHNDFAMDEEWREGGVGTDDDGFYVAVLTRQGNA
jgi:16S rRNA (cytosine967-C5)-methyltransferase